MAIEVRAANWDDHGSTDELRDAILTKSDQPMVFKGKTDSWTFARTWSPTEICQILRHKRTTFKICPRHGTDTFHKRFKENEVIFETQCEYIEGSFLDFKEWLEDAIVSTTSPEGNTTADSDHVQEQQPIGQPPKKFESEQAAKKFKLEQEEEENEAGTLPKSEIKSPPTNPFSNFSHSEYWAYADYKYMCELCSDMPELQSAIDWSVFGFQGRDGKDSTLWVGSEGACTPCHYDTYGCNLVAQLWGRKRWLLFAPEESGRLYPTRLPYEESSVFSSVNVCRPDLATFPEFAGAKAFEVVLSPGDVLFVPRHWWHYVECLEPAVSVNTWIDLPSDTHDRVKEAVVRTLVSVFATEQETEKEWMNPNEAVFSLTENVDLLSWALQQRSGQLPSAGCPPRDGSSISKEAFVRAVTTDRVVGCIVEELLSGRGAQSMSGPSESRAL